MKRFVTYLLILLVAVPATAGGNKYVDSLTVLLGKSKEDTTKVTLLNLLAIEMIGVSPDSSFKYVDLAFDLAESLGSDLKIAQCYNITGNIYRGKFEYDKALDLHWEVLEMYRDLGENLGWSFLEIGSDHYWMNNFDTARQYFNEAAIEFGESNNDNGRAISFNNIGMVDQVQGNYLEALRLFVKAAEIFEQMGRVNGIAWSYELIADVYYQEGNSDKALDYLLKSKKIYGKMRDTRGLMKAYLKLGPIYSSLGDRTEALNNYSLAMQFGEDLGDMISVAIANNKMGEIYVDKREYERALRYRRSALEIQESIGDELNMSITLNGIGEIYIKMGNSAAAIQHLDRSVETAQKIGYKNILKSSYRLLASAHQLKEDYKKAFQYQVMYTELSDEVYNEKRMQKILELQAKYEDKKDQEEIKLLTKENRIQELEARRDGIFNYSLFIGMILSSLLGFVIFNRNRIKQKALRDLKSINDEMEDAIEARTKEVIVQKEEIEKTY
ncbi:MAG: tetratricopeptide repeat protein, partial [Flavobacteriales bacterium]|nr:tetratricopeptide repeat protein [Flavobacteriales bacterium]